MIKFIQQEASEKAQEIKLKADEEYNIEKLYMGFLRVADGHVAQVKRGMIRVCGSCAVQGILKMFLNPWLLVTRVTF